MPAALDLNASCRRAIFSSYPIGTEDVTVFHRGHPPAVLPDYVVSFILGCTDFQPLKTHLHVHAELYSWDRLQLESLCQWLPAAIEAGLLLYKEEIIRRLRTSGGAAPPVHLRKLGIPTGGDRAHFVRRTVESFAGNLKTHGRSAEFLIADSSVSSDHSQMLRTLAVQLGAETGMATRFCGAEEKRSFIAAMEKEGISRAALEFALLDPLSGGFACGANRNAILLDAVGEAFCSADDDAICEFTRPTEATEPGLECMSGADPYHRRTFVSREDAVRSASWESLNYFAEHERMLGQNAAGFLQRSAFPVHIEDANDAILHRLTHHQPVFRATYPGHIGDPGIPAALYYLYYAGENLAHLTAAHEHYEAALSSRSVLAVTPRHTMADCYSSPGISMALDHREILPPFFPVLHAEDFSWSAALWQCCPDSVIGHLPFAIHHAPAPGKPILLPSQFREGHRGATMEFAHLLRRWIFDLPIADGRSGAEGIAALGRFLDERSRISPGDFAEMLRCDALRQISERCCYLSELLATEDGPDFWRQDVEALIGNMRGCVADEGFEIPLDLRPGRTTEEARAWMQSATQSYAQLLQEWPHMVKAATSLKERGVTIGQ